MEEVKSIITDGGIPLSEPTGPMAGIIKSAQSAANMSRSAAKPQVEFLETEDKTLLTIYRFEDEEQAQKVEELLMKFKEMNKTPEAFEKLVRKQKILRVKNILMEFRYEAGNGATPEKIEGLLVNM
ncbi:hypothetical protein ACFL0R_07390 [Pseudomonadota bacterium]